MFPNYLLKPLAKKLYYDKIITKNLFAKRRNNMYAYIKGTLEIKGINYVVIENNGIGFKIFMSSKSIGCIGNVGDIVKVHTHYHVREDDISLYGFVSEEELRMFEILINVSGVGVKSALTMLSDITPASFAMAVIQDDVTRLTKVPGVGKKTAQRLILELISPINPIISYKKYN